MHSCFWSGHFFEETLHVPLAQALEKQQQQERLQVTTGGGRLPSVVSAPLSKSTAAAGGVGGAGLVAGGDVVGSAIGSGFPSEPLPVSTRALEGHGSSGGGAAAAAAGLGASGQQRDRSAFVAGPGTMILSFPPTPQDDDGRRHSAEEGKREAPSPHAVQDEAEQGLDRGASPSFLSVSSQRHSPTDASADVTGTGATPVPSSTTEPPSEADVQLPTMEGDRTPDGLSPAASSTTPGDFGAADAVSLRKTTFSDDDDWELAMIRKEVAMLEKTTGPAGAAAAGAGALPGMLPAGASIDSQSNPRTPHRALG